MRSVKKNIHWLLLLLMPAVMAIHTYVLYTNLNFDFTTALQDAIINIFYLSFSLWSIILIIKNYPTTAVIFLYALIIAFAISLIATFAENKTLNWWLADANTDYKLWLKNTLPIRFLFILLFNSWMATNGAMRKIINLSESRYQQQADASVLLKEAELFKLRQQLQPHFLYNSLNSINALIIIAPDKAQEMIGKLSDFLRSSVKRESEETLKITDELNYLQSYLDIESIRFGDRLIVDFDNDYPTNAVIPPFLLQPIIENAIKFGLYGKTGVVVITVAIKLVGQLLIITNPYAVPALGLTALTVGFGYSMPVPTCLKPIKMILLLPQF